MQEIAKKIKKKTSRKRPWLANRTLHFDAIFTLNSDLQLSSFNSVLLLQNTGWEFRRRNNLGSLNISLIANDTG